MRVWHLIDPVEWAAAAEQGTYEPASLAAEGFVHFSFLDQVEATAARHYRDAIDLIAVELDTDAIAAPLRVEGLDERFPHVYGPIPTAAARRSLTLQRDTAGQWRVVEPT